MQYRSEDEILRLRAEENRLLPPPVVTEEEELMQKGFMRVPSRIERPAAAMSNPTPPALGVIFNVDDLQLPSSNTRIIPSAKINQQIRFARTTDFVQLAAKTQTTGNAIVTIDILVNAANRSLNVGPDAKGVTESLRNAAGMDEFQRVCTLAKTRCQLKGRETGDFIESVLDGPVGIRTGVVLTTEACQLTKRGVSRIYHCVGPNVLEDGMDETALAACYSTALDMAARDLPEKKSVCIAFPVLSGGLSGYPPDEAARVEVRSVRRWYEDYRNAKHVHRVHVLFTAFQGKNMANLTETNRMLKYLGLFFPREVMPVTTPTREPAIPYHVTMTRFTSQQANASFNVFKRAGVNVTQLPYEQIVPQLRLPGDGIAIAWSTALDPAPAIAYKGVFATQPFQTHQPICACDGFILTEKQFHSIATGASVPLINEFKAYPYDVPFCRALIKGYVNDGKRGYDGAIFSESSMELGPGLMANVSRGGIFQANVEFATAVRTDSDPHDPLNVVCFLRATRDIATGDELFVDSAEWRQIRRVPMIPEDALEPIMLQDLHQFIEMRTPLYRIGNLSYENGFAYELEKFAEAANLLSQPHIYRRGYYRYDNITLHEHSRVKLGNNRFLHASWIVLDTEGKSNPYPRRYIATDAPVVGAFENFWRVVWNEKVVNIAMLTSLQEKGDIKADRYWPLLIGTSVTYDGIRITLTSEDTDKVLGVTVRVFTLKDTTSDALEREIYQTHILHWEDMKTMTPKSLFDIWKEFATMADVTSIGLGSPILVHCSAGVGRTGVFIGIDYLMHDLMRQHEQNPATTALTVDLLGVVVRMRKCRPGMVQTPFQYKLMADFVEYAMTLERAFEPAPSTRMAMAARKAKTGSVK